jgi:hypothetical protein
LAKPLHSLQVLALLPKVALQIELCGVEQEEMNGCVLFIVDLVAEQHRDLRREQVLKRQVRRRAIIPGIDVHDRLVAGNQRCLGRSVAGTGTATRSRAARPSSGSAPRGIHPTIVARVARRRSRLRARRVDGLQVHDPAPRTAVTALSNDLGPSSPHKSCQDCIIATCGHDFRDGQGAKLRPQTGPGHA